MDEAEQWIAMLDAIGRHAVACASELRALRARLGDSCTTREDESTSDDGPADMDG